jgi:hypothetical protein
MRQCGSHSHSERSEEEKNFLSPAEIRIPDRPNRSLASIPTTLSQRLNVWQFPQKYTCEGYLEIFFCPEDDAAYSSETSVNFYQTRRHYIPENSDLCTGNFLPTAAATKRSK